VTTQDVLDINRAGWDVVAPLFCGGTALPFYGPLAPTEDGRRAPTREASARAAGTNHAVRRIT
jgi:hypothetical protein